METDPDLLPISLWSSMFPSLLLIWCVKWGWCQLTEMKQEEVRLVQIETMNDHHELADGHRTSFFLHPNKRLRLNEMRGIGRFLCANFFLPNLGQTRAKSELLGTVPFKRSNEPGPVPSIPSPRFHEVQSIATIIVEDHSCGGHYISWNGSPSLNLFL